MIISQKKKDKIAEQILSYIYYIFPKQPFTSEIAREIARDEEFIKSMLFELKQKGLVVPIRKNSKGIIFTRRIKWRLSNKIHQTYKSSDI